VVSTLGLGGPVYSQVGDKSCWASALRTATCWLENGSADHVLVLGAEEFEPHELEAFRAARWLQPGRSFRTGEGAGAILLGRDGPVSAPRIARVADGFGYRGRRDARRAASDCLTGLDPALPIVPTASGWLLPIAEPLENARPPSGLAPLPCEAFAVSAAWDTIRAARALERGPGGGLVVPYWGLSQQIAAAEIRSGITGV